MSRRKTPSVPPTDPDLGPVENAQQQVAEILGSIAEFWGFTRTQGRIFGLVYLSPEPLGQRAIREKLAISAGSASMTIQSLVQWGVLLEADDVGSGAHRTYVAETNFFALITKVMRERERGQVQRCIQAAREAGALLAAADPNDPRVAFARERVEHLLGFFEAGRALLDALVERTPVHGLLDRVARHASRLARRHLHSSEPLTPHVRIDA